MRVRLLLGLVLLAALASPAGAAERLKRHAVAGEGMSLAVPVSWLALDRRQLDTQAILDRLARDNPRLAPFVQSFGQRGSPVRFLAVDPSVRGDFATNVNVVSVPVPSGVTFDQYRGVLLQEVQALTRGGRVEQATVRIGGSRALRLGYRFRLTAAGRQQTVQTLQYGFLRPRKSVVVTYTTIPRLAASYGPAFRASAASIRFRG